MKKRWDSAREKDTVGLGRVSVVGEGREGIRQVEGEIEARRQRRTEIGAFGRTWEAEGLGGRGGGEGEQESRCQLSIVRTSAGCLQGSSRASREGQEYGGQSLHRAAAWAQGDHGVLGLSWGLEGLQALNEGSVGRRWAATEPPEPPPR